MYWLLFVINLQSLPHVEHTGAWTDMPPGFTRIAT